MRIASAAAVGEYSNVIYAATGLLGTTPCFGYAYTGETLSLSTEMPEFGIGVLVTAIITTIGDPNFPVVMGMIVSLTYRLLKNTHLLCCAPIPSCIATYGKCTTHSSGFRAPCIWMFLTSLGEIYFFNNRIAGKYRPPAAYGIYVCWSMTQHKDTAYRRSNQQSLAFYIAVSIALHAVIAALFLPWALRHSSREEIVEVFVIGEGGGPAGTKGTPGKAGEPPAGTKPDMALQAEKRASGW